MSDRDAETLLPPPPPDAFVEPPEARQTEPPVNPAIIEAIRLVVREEIAQLSAQVAAIDANVEALRNEIGALAKQWGMAFIDQKSFTERVDELAKNAVALAQDALKALPARDSAMQNHLNNINANINAVRLLLDLPAHGSVAEIAALATVNAGGG